MSGDFLTAAGFGGWNTVQYAFLQHAIAQECGLEAGIFMHVVQDLHLYNRHVPQAMEMIERHSKCGVHAYNSYSTDPFPTPKIKIGNKPFFELTADDVELDRYLNHGKIDRLEVAI